MAAAALWLASSFWLPCYVYNWLLLNSPFPLNFAQSYRVLGIGQFSI